MKCKLCKAERERRMVAEASARAMEMKLKALRREMQAIRAGCDTARIRHE